MKCPTFFGGVMPPEGKGVVCTAVILQCLSYTRKECNITELALGGKTEQ